MSKNKTRTNLLYNMVYQITIMILPLITTPYISRVIGAEGIGIYSYYMAIAQYFIYFAMLGMSNYGNRLIAKNSHKPENIEKTYSELYATQLITAISSLFVYVLFCLITASTNLEIAIIVSLYVASTIFDVSWYFFGLQKFKLTSICQLLVRILAFASVFIFVHSREDLPIYTFILSFSHLFGALILWIISKKNVNLQIKYLNKNIIRKHMKVSLICFVPIIATTLYRSIDKVMIGNMMTMTDVGYYESSEKIITITLGIINAITMVLMPKVSKLLATSKKAEAIALIEKTLNISMCIGIALAFGIGSVAKDFVPFFFGSDFTPSIVLTIGLSVSVPFVTWSAIIRTLYLLPFELDNIYMKATIFGLIINVIGNIFMINFFGTLGAVFATIFSEIFVCIYQSCYASKQLKYLKTIQSLICYIIVGALMALIVVAISNSLNAGPLWKLIAEIGLGGIFYSGLTAVYLFKTKTLKIRR